MRQYDKLGWTEMQEYLAFLPPLHRAKWHVLILVWSFGVRKTMTAVGIIVLVLLGTATYFQDHRISLWIGMVIGGLVMGIAGILWVIQVIKRKDRK